MSAEDQTLSVAELAAQAERARARLQEDVAALAYKVSPENLEHEAKDAARHVAHEAQRAVLRWRSRAGALMRRNPLAVGATLGCAGLLYAGLRRSDARLVLGALACGAAAITLGLQTKHAPPRLTTANAMVD